MTDSIKLIFADLDANSNKFWTAERNGSVVTFTWGRVGDAGQSKTKDFGDDWTAQRAFEKKRDEKLGKGYTEQRTVGSSSAAAPVGNLKAIARKQIKHDTADTETAKLIDFLVRRNIHKIEGVTALKWDEANAQFTTPLGPVTDEGLDEAKVLLKKIGQCVTDGCPDPTFTRLVNLYLRIIPSKIGRRSPSPHDLFPDVAAVRKAIVLVDSMKAVVQTATDDSTKDTPEVFKTTLTKVDSSDPEFKRIDTLFKKTLKGGHTSGRMRLVKVWKVEVAGAEAAFQADGAKVGNVKELWHGTKDTNLLSLLKSGYVIPRSSGSSIQITGRAYGDGVYFSDISTKSLNYATSYWGGQGSQRSFMLLNDVAMGREGNPNSRGYGSRYPLPGTDSTFARGGSSGGFINNEMVVYRTSQIRPKYLCEFA